MPIDVAGIITLLGYSTRHACIMEQVVVFSF